MFIAENIVTFLLSVHCNLVSVTVDVNNVPMAKGPGLQPQYINSVVLNQALVKGSNEVAITFQNEWGEPERDKAFCDVSLEKVVENTHTVISRWSWNESDSPIGFKPQTTTLSFEASDNYAALAVNDKSIFYHSTDELLQTIKQKIESGSPQKLVTNTFYEALSRKYITTLDDHEWEAAEIAFWSSIMDESIEVSLTELPAANHDMQGYQVLLGEWDLPPIIITSGDRELGLKLTLKNEAAGYRVWGIEYMLSQEWKK